MRVGLTVYGSLAERSGGFHYDRRLVAGLRESGHTVEVVELPWRAYHRGLADNISGQFRRRLDVDVDVMLQDELAHPSLVRTNRALDYPIVSVVHHLRASESRSLAPLYRAVERRYLATVDAAVCTSGVTRDVVTGVGVDPDSVVVAPPAGDRFDPDIDQSAIESRVREEPFQVVFVGNVTPRKGLDTLVEGLAAADGDAELTAVGRHVDDQHAESVRRRVRELGLEHRVTLAGELPDGDLEATLASAHVLAVPSQYEGFGIVYLEGMSYGLPAIASSAGGATDIVADGETGFLVDPDDPAAVARAISTLATDRDRLAELGTAARRRYEAHPDWAETTARVETLLTEVAATAEVPA